MLSTDATPAAPSTEPAPEPPASPPAATLDVKELQSAVDRALVGLHCELWPGEAWHITDLKERTLAAAFMTEFILRVFFGAPAV